MSAKCRCGMVFSTVNKLSRHQLAADHKPSLVPVGGTQRFAIEGREYIDDDSHTVPAMARMNDA